MKNTAVILSCAVCVLLAACANQISYGPTRPGSAPAPQSAGTGASQPPASPKPTPVMRPTPYPIPQKPDTGISPLSSQADQPIWQRKE